MLVWAGSAMFDNRNVFDFKAVWHIDSEPRLSFILNHDSVTKGSGIVLNQHYQIELEVVVTNDLKFFNMHEFKILQGGKTAMVCTYRPQEKDLSDFNRPDETSWITTGGFVELDMETSEVLHEWDSFDRIGLYESNSFHAWDDPSQKPGYDYVHINAIDKTDAGNYILSMRFTDTIYLVGGKDGRIIWRLGGRGRYSDFKLDFTFSK
jgi:hypothetical protein